MSLNLRTSTPVSAIAGLPPQVLQTYKRLVQYLHEGHFHDGDKLPSQAELRHLLGRNHYTLSSAMAALTARGVITRDRRAGTVVQDLTAIGPVPWSVGVASVGSPVPGVASAFSHLNSRVQAHLHAATCRCLTYSFQPNKETESLSQFGLLPQDLNAQLLDGIVVFSRLDLDEWRQVRDARIPVLHAPFWEQAPAGVITDYGAYTYQAASESLAAGCRRLAVVAAAQVADDCVQGLQRALADHGLPAESAEWIIKRPTLVGGQEVAEAWLAAAATNRPDAFIMFDDIATLGVAKRLASASERPRLSTVMHRELPQHYPFAVACWAIDLEALASDLAAMMISRLLRPAAPDVLRRSPPTRLPDA